MQEEYKELSIKDILIFVQETIKLFLSKWKMVILLGVVFGVIYTLLALSKPVYFSEKLTFMMDEKSGNDIPGLDIIGNLFGGGKGGDDNIGKILELFESKKIIHNMLFQKMTMNGNTDFVANQMLSFYTVDKLADGYKKYGILQGWPDQLRSQKDFRFKHASIDSFTNNENLFLRLLFDKINGNVNYGIPTLLTSDLDAESGIMTIHMKSMNEDITIGVLENVYEQLSQFFIDRTIEKQLKTFNIVKEKRDSILGELKVKEYALADFKDRNRNLVTVKGYLDQLRLERDVTILNVMYAEVIKQLELTDFSLRNKTPIVQTIDVPRRPIFPNTPSLSKSFIIGAFIGAVLALLFVFLKHQYKTIMESE